MWQPTSLHKPKRKFDKAGLILQRKIFLPVVLMMCLSCSLFLFSGEPVIVKQETFQLKKHGSSDLVPSPAGGVVPANTAVSTEAWDVETETNTTNMTNSSKVESVAPSSFGGKKSSTPPFVIEWDGWKTVDSWMKAYWHVNTFCDAIWQHRGNRTAAEAPIKLKVSFSCQELFRESYYGTGNFVLGFYGVRLTARVVGGIDITLECSDASEYNTRLIMPWLMGSFPGGATEIVTDVASTDNGTYKNDVHIPMPTNSQVCSNYKRVPLVQMLPVIRYELRRMAIALVGVPSPYHPSAAFAERYLWNSEAMDHNTMQLPTPARNDPPLIRNVTLDDTVLHFRCGDLMDTDNAGYGFMSFNAFAKHISPDVRSIGILTQPFVRSGQTRTTDGVSSTGDKCRIVVMAYVDYLTERFPRARISVHNGPNETIALAYARMTMANQTMAGVGSFGVFPVMASFGTGYVRKPMEDKASNQFLMLSPNVEKVVRDIVLMDEPNLLVSKKVKKMWKNPNGRDLVLDWFKNAG